MFFSQIRLRQGLPFPVEVPNEITQRTFEATDRGAGDRAGRNGRGSILRELLPVPTVGNASTDTWGGVSRVPERPPRR